MGALSCSEAMKVTPLDLHDGPMRNEDPGVFPVPLRWVVIIFIMLPPSSDSTAEKLGFTFPFS